MLLIALSRPDSVFTVAGGREPIRATSSFARKSSPSNDTGTVLLAEAAHTVHRIAQYASLPDISGGSTTIGMGHKYGALLEGQTKTRVCWYNPYRRRCRFASLSGSINAET
jgi:hypothetical protein